MKKGDMAAINYATCSVNDLIAHSLELHPQLLADRVRFHARVLMHTMIMKWHEPSSISRIV
jgi:hypothetical protein